MNQNDTGNNNVDTAKELPTVLSFCSGYGGIERGLDLAGFSHTVLAHVEIEAYAIAVMAKKMENGELLPTPIWSNLKTLPVEPFRNRVDLITGGYPCQPFSAAGKRLGEEDPRHLWPHIRRHIESIRPVRCFFENVEGHISLGLRGVISDLEALGYRTTWGIFSAREVGAPHQRKRVYILADSNSVRCDRGQLPHRDSERPVEIEAQQRPQQSVVRSEVEGRGRKTRKSHWEIESRLGRVVDGCADRVDRIRLLGNGVVPQTAAKAWITLNSRLNTTQGR